MTQQIKLPPFNFENEPQIQTGIDKSGMPTYSPGLGVITTTEAKIKAYATAAIEADRQASYKQLAAYKRITESLEWRIALLQKQYDELKKTTDPSLLESERAANSLLTEEVEALKANQQARGEPVCGSPVNNKDVCGEQDAIHAPQILEGYKLVPIEPTEEMIVEGFESAPDEHFTPKDEWERFQAMSGCQQAAHKARLCWKAMIKAAPKP